MPLTRVFQPIKIGNVEVPNRVVRTAHGTHFSADRLTDDFIAYHAARAKGGCGLTILEIASVHPSSVGTIRSFDDRIIPDYRRLMDAVRPYGMKVFQQLHHGGVNFPGMNGIAWSASAVPGPLGFVPQAMTKGEIAEVVAAFAAAAVRCREGGLDGVEIHGAHGYLFHQFLSPITNRRNDEYGGSLDNRLRLLMETARAIRAAVGADFVLGVRLSATEAPAGVTIEDDVAAIKALEKERLIDFVDVSLGDYYRGISMNATMETPTGYELPSSVPIAAAASVPRIVAGRFRTLEEVEQVLRRGDADLVSMVRAQIADPDLVRKTREGHPERVRPCIACNQGCIGQLYRGGKLGCLVNPAVGFETQLSEDLIQRSRSPRKVLVVGGGPAGLEAARIAAIAGHKVILAEATQNLGGTINIAKRAPFLQTIGDIAQWLEQEVYRLGVDVRLGSYMDAEAVRAEHADVVIVATGSYSRKDGVQSMTPWDAPSGVDLPHVYTTTELLTSPPANFGRNALVLDDVGHVEAIAAVDALMARNVAVTFVTRHPMLTPYVESTLRTTPAMERFNKGDFRLMTRTQLKAIRASECVVRPLQGTREETVAAELVVLITPNAPLDELYTALRDEHDDIRRIGDAAAPRDVQSALAEARRVAMSIG
jgi:2,4-dienoyl-CoA reductase-like NADH-dependent reductase (Old Yellow Enzyme family)/thioredoxin reductase